MPGVLADENVTATLARAIFSGAVQACAIWFGCDVIGDGLLLMVVNTGELKRVVTGDLPVQFEQSVRIICFANSRLRLRVRSRLIVFAIYQQKRE